ncbi:potassium-transporting ATPase subunit F [Brevibacillus sp. SCSIO 07484]
MVRQHRRRLGRGSPMTLVIVFTVAIFLYLVYALIYPEKF